MADTQSVSQGSAAHTFDLFIIHSFADADFVRGYLLPALDLPPSRVLLVDELTPGAMIATEIDCGVARSRFTILVLSPAYLEDRWAVFGEQLASYLSAQGVHVIPLRLSNCKLPLRIEARVALDFTKRANWESETTRLRELLRTNGASPGIADLSGYSGDYSRAMRPQGATAPRKLELVDVFFADNEPRHTSSSCPVVDLKMVNHSTSTILVKRVDMHIQTIWTVPAYHPGTIALGILNCSASYDLTIPDRAPPFVLNQQVSHVLKPDEAERFRIVLHRPASGFAVLSMIAKVVHGAEGFEESSGELLCAFRNYDKLGRWDADAHRTCLQLAREVRARKGHMSKRLLELLEEIESGRRVGSIQ